MNRRHFLTHLSVLACARNLLAASVSKTIRLGLCSFSCHQHWNAARERYGGVKFSDAPGFYRYARTLGSEGVQTSLRGASAADLRKLVEETGGYYEGEVRLPKNRSDLADFETEVSLVRDAGATVARAVFTGGRRYEIFTSRADFQAFHTQAAASLALAEPVLRKHRLKMAVENHKDHTAGELVDLIKAVSSEWIGVLVDTGNNIALLEDPHSVVEALAPYALSVHLKDMAVQSTAGGFLLSEVPLGSGALDLPRIVATLARANPSLVFNLEMATRDPLRIPCLEDGFFVTYPEDQSERLETMMQWVEANPPRDDPPRVSNKPPALVLAEEEDNNRHSLRWMKDHIHV